MTMAPDAFERLARRLLREADFDSVSVTGQSGGGIDGLGVYRLGLVSFPVFFQCKRYRGSVGPGAVRDFRGAMAGRGDKGLLTTTGSFNADVKKEATRDGAPPIDLLTVAAYDVGGTQVLVPQRIESARRVRELSDAQLSARRSGTLYRDPVSSGQPSTGPLPEGHLSSSSAASRSSAAAQPHLNPRGSCSGGRRDAAAKLGASRSKMACWMPEELVSRAAWLRTSLARQAKSITRHCVPGEQRRHLAAARYSRSRARHASCSASRWSGSPRSTLSSLVIRCSR